MAAIKSYVDVFLISSIQHHISNSTMIGIWWNKASKAFWRHDFWLPLGLKWEDLVDTEDLRYRKFHDVWMYPIIFAILLLLVKNFILVPFLLNPLAQLAGIPNKQHRPPKPCPALEAGYLRYKNKPSVEELMEASSKTGMSTRQVESWLRRRHLCDESTLHEKFVERGFNLICHTGNAVHALVVLSAKPWFWNVSVIWKGFPHHIDDDLWWCYMLGLTFYWASSFMQIYSFGRSTHERTTTLIHHLFAIMVTNVSWVCIEIRYGALMYMQHEISSIPIQIIKMCTYADMKKAAEVALAVAFVTWSVTRCYMYGFWIVWEVFTRIDERYRVNIPIVSLLQGVSMLIQLWINVRWTMLMGLRVKNNLSGGAQEHVRCDREDVSDDEESSDADKKDV